ncbi:MAG: glycosyltransferase [Candidatus Sericytochromatia bacterium]
MSKPCVLLLSTFPYRQPRHGGQIRLANLAAVFEAAGFAVRGVALYEPESYQKAELGPHDLDFPPDSPYRLFEGRPQIFLNDMMAGRYAAADDGGYGRLLRQLPERVDVVFAEQPWLWPAARRLKETPQCREALLVFGSENIEEPLKRSIFASYAHANEPALQAIAALERQACAEADLTLAVTAADLAVLEGFGAKKAMLAPNGIAPWTASEAKLAEWRGKLPRAPWLLYVASAHPPNFTGFMDVVGDSLACIPPNSRLVVAGSVGPHLAERLMSSRWHAINGTRLQVLGGLPDEDLAAVKTLAHAFLLPIQDGGGSNIKTAEALYSGAHVIGTPVSFRGYEAFTEAPRVHLAPSPEAFQAHIRRVLRAERPAPLSEAAEAARLSVRWDHCLSALPTTIEELLASRRIPA